MKRITSLPSTLSFAAAAHADWEIVIIGAGISGAIAALEAGRRGVRVLLVDRSNFPRPKVCGCCLNRAALQLLGAAGLANIPVELGGQQLFEFQLASSRRIAKVPLDGGIAVSREQLDAALIRAAIQNGVQFLASTLAYARPNSAGCQVILKQQNQERTAAARVAIVATGLGARCVVGDATNLRRNSPRSRIGAGAILDGVNADYAAGIIHMACHRTGYVGLVRLEDGRLDIATALDISAVRRFGGVARAAAHIIKGSALPTIRGLDQEEWRGTAKLTQRRARVYGEGYLVVGDAAGYVEPFTGEGIAWAMATGRAVVPYAMRAIEESTARIGPSWSHEYRRVVGRRMRVCRAISLLVRHPRLVELALIVLARRSQLAAPIVNSLNFPLSVAEAPGSG